MYVLGPRDCWALRIVQFDCLCQRLFWRKKHLLLLPVKWEIDGTRNRSYRRPTHHPLHFAQGDRGERGRDMARRNRPPPTGGQRHFSNVKRREGRKTRKQEEDGETGTRPHLYTPTPATPPPPHPPASPTLFKVQPWLWNLHKTNSLCALP